MFEYLMVVFGRLNTYDLLENSVSLGVNFEV